jgi:hypothetical protein
MLYGFITEAAAEEPATRSDIGMKIDFGANYMGLSLDEARALHP